MKRIITLLKKLKKINFFLKPSSIIIFDGLSLQDLRYILDKKKYFTLEDRLERIKILYITPKALINFLYFFFYYFKNYSLKVIYTIALIKSLKAKVVITSIDNSINFFLCAKILHKKIL